MICREQNSEKDRFAAKNRKNKKQTAAFSVKKKKQNLFIFLSKLIGIWQI